MSLKRSAEFFAANAGYSYDPKKETPSQGRRRCARALAKAQAKALDDGYSFEWQLDGFTNREWTDEGPEYNTWVCLMHAPDGEVCESLGGVDFGHCNGVAKDPWSSNYRLVVEAELALEHFPT